MTRKPVVLSYVGLWTSLCLWGGLPVSPCQSAPPAPIPASGGGVGQEMKQVEKSLQDDTKARKNRAKAPPAILIKPGSDAKTPRAAEATGPAFAIKKLTLRGDVDFMDKLRLSKDVEKDLVGHTLSAAEIRALADKYKETLVKRGYYLASIWVVPADYSKGEVVFEVDKGRIGRMKFHNVGAPKSRYEGRYFAEEQLRRRMANLELGRTFDYGEFYATMFAINSHPDLTLDTDLSVRTEEGRRYADMDFAVKESLPLHAVLSVANSGTEATGDWRPGLTLQHLNLTKSDDILSLSLGPISEDVKSMTSYGASYYRPYYAGHGGGVTLFGGYSILDAKDVVQDINIEGQGYFAGVQGSYRAIANDVHQLQVSMGIAYRTIEDRIILAASGTDPEFRTDARQVTLAPISAGLSYSSARPDRIGGRNFLTSQTSGNFEDFPGVSDEKDIQSQRLTAKATYFIERLQAARIQPLVPSLASRSWTVFVRADGQLASGALVPAEQKAIGGADTVRGFPERVVQGDQGVSGSFELRAPVIPNWHRALGIGETAAGKKPMHDVASSLLEFVLFADGGYVKIEDALGEKDSYTLASVGAGFRLEVTSHAQLRFDWGVPMSGRKEVGSSSTEEVSSGGRYHLSAQVQF